MPKSLEHRSLQAMGFPIPNRIAPSIIVEQGLKWLAKRHSIVRIEAVLGTWVVQVFRDDEFDGEMFGHKLLWRAIAKAIVEVSKAKE